jgi:hypothetical protein
MPNLPRLCEHTCSFINNLVKTLESVSNEVIYTVLMDAMDRRRTHLGGPQCLA